MGKKNSHYNTEHEVEVENRRRIVAANLLAGATYREIAQVVNVDAATVMRDRRAILDDWKKHYAEDYERLVAQQSRRYDIILNSLWKDATADNPHLGKLDRLLKVMERQDRILGITERVDVTSGGKPIQPTITIQAVDYRSAIAPLAPLN